MAVTHRASTAVNSGDAPQTELSVGARRIGALLHKAPQQVFSGELQEDPAAFRHLDVHAIPLPLLAPSKFSSSAEFHEFMKFHHIERDRIDGSGVLQRGLENTSPDFGQTA